MEHLEPFPRHEATPTRVFSLPPSALAMVKSRIAAKDKTVAAPFKRLVA